jgi:hypothetical protein
MTARESLLALVESLPEAMVEEATRVLTEMRDDPWAWALKNAEFDDEPYTKEDRAASQRAEADRIGGRLVPDEEVGRMLNELCAKSPGPPALSSRS